MEGTKNETEERKDTKESRKIGASAVQVCSRSHCRGHTTLRSRRTPDQGPVREGVRSKGTDDDLGATRQSGRSSGEDSGRPKGKVPSETGQAIDRKGAESFSCINILE